MALFEDFLQVTIDGTDVSDYVLSYQRNNSLCEPGTSFSLGFTRKKPNGDVLKFSVSDPVIIYEKYPSSDLVLRGFITSLNANANNTELRVVGMDKYILLSDYFVPDRYETAGQSVAYWMSFLCGLVNLSVQFDTYPGIPTAGADGNGGTSLGMQRAAEALMTLERKGAVYTRYDSDVDKIVVFTLDDAQPKVTINSSNLVTFDRSLGVKSTRNVVKVYGGHSYDWLTQQSHAYNAIARTSMGELIVDQTFALGSSEIRSHTFAAIVASRILAITATLDDIVVAECAGLYPNVKITHNATINISQGDISYHVDRMITSKGIAVTKGGGAITTFTFGEKCPRITISPPPYFVYASYEGAQGGAAISYDAGDSFYQFNDGLPASGIPSQSIAANAYNQLMLVTTSGVYKRAGVGDIWNRVTVLDSTYPSNDEGDHQFLPTDIVFQKVEKEAGFLNRFHLLGFASGGANGALPPGQERWWAYFTPDYGYTWSSMQMYVPGSGIAVGTASGLPMALINGNGITPAQLRELNLTSGSIIWNVHAHDMEGDINGNVTVLMEVQGPEYIPEDTTTAETFYTTAVSYNPPTTSYNWYGHTWWMDGSSPYQGNDRSNWIIGNEILSDGNAMYPIGARTGNNAVFSIPNNREIAYAVIEHKGVVGGGVSVARTNGYRPAYGYQDVPQWEKVASAYFDEQPETDFFGLEGYSVLLDYSSLQSGSDKVKFCIIGACLEAGGGGDNYPGSCHIFVNCYFFEDDISIPASGVGVNASCTVTNDNRIIGIKDYPGDPITYYGEGTYGWENQDGETASPTPRGWHQIEPMPQGGQPSAITQNLTGGGNTGYWAIIVHDTGYYHGDDRDAGWPGEQHPRDWGEKGSIGIYTAKIDFDAKEITGIGLWQEFAPDFHDPGPDPEQPLRDIDIEDWNSGQSMTCTFIQPDLIFFTENWDAQGGLYGHYLTYPGLSHSKNEDWDDFAAQGNHQYSTPINQWEGVRKTAFYSGTTIGYAAYGRELDGGEWVGPVDSRMLYKNYSEATIAEPPVAPSGMLKYYKGHPDFGYCATERRATANYPLTNDFIFMWKAQRATPNVFEVMGNSSRYTDPYAQTAYGVPYSLEWDFRTASGSVAHPSGGAFFNWNWLSG